MIGKTLKLRTAVREIIKGVTGLQQVYFRKAPANVKTPFSVFLLDRNRSEENIEEYDLTVEVSDYGSDDTQVETLADMLEEGLEKYYYNDYDIQFRIYIETRNVIEDSDKNIIRRRLTFTLYMCERS